MILQPLIEEGLPTGHSIAIIGSPGSGKTSLCFSLVEEYVSRGAEVLYLTTENTPTTIIRDSNGIGINLSTYVENSTLKFIDAYSWRTGSKKDKLADGTVSSPGNLSEVNLFIQRTSRTLSPESLVVLDSVSGLALNTPDKTKTKSFIHVLSQRMNNQNMTLILVLEDGAHSPQFILSLRGLVQGTIQLRRHDSENGRIDRSLRVHSLLGKEIDTHWTDFLIGASGPYLSEGEV